MNNEFVFEKVVLIKPYVFIIIGLLIVGPVIIGIATVFTQLGVAGGKLIGLVVGFGLMLFIFSRLSKRVVISFSNDHIDFKVNDKLYHYLKTDLEGFYSFNYLQTKNCTVSMSFHFRDGKKMDLSNYNFDSGKFDPGKHEILVNFLKATEQELNFKPLTTNKSRSISKIGDVWFSRG